MYGVKLIATEFTYDEVASHFWARQIDVVRVVGKKLPVRLYEILEAVDAPRDPKKAEVVAVFVEGWAAVLLCASCL